MNFFNFFSTFKYRFREKYWGYNRATGSLITRKILMYNIDFCDKNISKIRNITSTLNIFF